MRLKRALLLAVGIGLAGYAVLKVTLYYQVKTELNRLTAMLAPFAVLSYDAIESDLTGSVAVTGVRVTPVEAPVGIGIERIELQGEGTRFLLGLLQGFDPARPPRRLQLSISRLQAPLGGDYPLFWRPAAAATVPDLCSLAGLFGQTEIERLGFRQRLADARLRYDYDPRSGALSLLVGYTLDGLSALSLEMALANILPPGSAVSGGMPTLERFSLQYHIDPGYMHRAIEYCADQAGRDPALFIEELFTPGSADFANSLGFVPGQDLRSALRRLITQPGELLLTSVPDSRFSPAGLARYKPRELVEMLGIRLSVNDQPVEDLSFTLPDGDAALSSLIGGNTPGVTDARAGEGAATATPAPRPRFVVTPLNRLHRYIGRDVRIHGAAGTVSQQGILMSLQDRQLELEQRLYGGKMTLYIPLEKIRRAEVLRWEQVEDETGAR